MPVRNSIQAMKDEFAAYRRELHENPQTAYEEEFARQMITRRLDEWGISYKQGYGKTGVVATIEGKPGERAIGLRADIDALDIIEQSGQPWASKTPGKMHGCGHDGHTAILLATAKYLNENPNFTGRVHLIFQPAEEGASGAEEMVKDGLFRDFPCDEVYALHNWPYLPLGQIAMRKGPIMAAVDVFNITIAGVGGHAAMPHNTVDPVTVAAQIISAFQTLVAREVDALDSAVISVTNLHAGTGAFNVIGESATLNGTVRSFRPETRDRLHRRMEEIAGSIAAAFGAKVPHFEMIRENEPTINDDEAAAFCARVAEAVFGPDNVDSNVLPCMGGEDFGVMLREAKGAFVFMGQGETNNPGSPHNRGLHHPGYDFNDEAIPYGVEYFTTLVEKALAA